MTEADKIANLARGVQDHEVRLRVLEKDSTVTQESVKSLCRKMDKIDNNTTWLLRLVIAGIIGALLAQVVVV